MKKVFKCLGMMALVALAFTSCKKTEEQSSTRAAMPQLIVEDEDRAYIDGNDKVHFEIGDRLMIFNISLANGYASHCAAYRAIGEGNEAEFVNSGMGTVGVALDGGYYAYYPSTLVDMGGGAPGFGVYASDRVFTELEQGDNKSKFLVSPEQEYREGYVARKDLYLAAKSEAPRLDVAEFELKFVCGVLRLKPFEAAQRTITKIEIVDNYFNLSGWTEVIIPEIDPVEMNALFNSFDPTNPTWVNSLNAWRTKTGFNVTGYKNPDEPEEGEQYMLGNKITLNLPEGGLQLGNTKDNTPVFNIVLRPLALTYGCHIIFTFDDGSTKDCAVPNNLKIKPNYIKPVNMNMDNYPD